jgi:hypothetical protein
VRTIIHVNQHNIKHNRKNEEKKPVLTVKTYKDNRLGDTAIIRDAAGKEIARIVYSPDKPLSCGAHVWIETQYPVDVD